MKYKVGDKVKVREDLVVGTSYQGFIFEPKMKEVKTITITEVVVEWGYYACKEFAKDLYYYDDEMLDGLIEGPFKPHMMRCWDNDSGDYLDCLVYADLSNIKEYEGDFPICGINSGGDLEMFKHAKEIPSKSFTKQQIADKLGISVNDFEIID